MHVGCFCYFEELHTLNIIFSVLGVDLKLLIQREFGDNPPPGAIPSMLETCFREVESRGLPEVGICEFGKWPTVVPSLRNSTDRIAGSTLEINGIKDALNHG